MFVSWKSSFFHSLSIVMFVMVDVVAMYVTRVQSLLRNGYADLGRHCEWKRKPIRGSVRSSRLSSNQSQRRQGYIPSSALARIHCLPLSHPPMMWNPATPPDMPYNMGLLHWRLVYCFPFFRLHIHFLICVVHQLCYSICSFVCSCICIVQQIACVYNCSSIK